MFPLKELKCGECGHGDNIVYKEPNGNHLCYGCAAEHFLNRAVDLGELTQLSNCDWCGQPGELSHLDQEEKYVCSDCEYEHRMGGDDANAGPRSGN